SYGQFLSCSCRSSDEKASGSRCRIWRPWSAGGYLTKMFRQLPAKRQVATESTTETPTVTRPTSPKSNKRHQAARPALHNVVVANVDPWNAPWARRAAVHAGLVCLCSAPCQDLPKVGKTRSRLKL